MQIRKAEQSDLGAILAIYNYEVVNGTATLDLHPRTLADWQIWFDAHNRDGENHPLYVAEENGTVLGYVSLSSYRVKEAYRSTVELSVYVEQHHRREGIASAMMAFVLDLARNDDSIHHVISVITSGNEASVRLHEKFGFRYLGTIPEVGMKHGKMIDIHHYSLILN